MGTLPLPGPHGGDAAAATRSFLPARYVRLLIVAAAMLVFTGIVLFPSAAGAQRAAALGRPAQGFWGGKMGKVKVAVVEPTAYHTEVLVSVVTTLYALGVAPSVFSAHPDAVQRDSPIDIAGLRPAHEMRFLAENGEYDVIVMNSCDAKYWQPHPALLQAIRTSASRVVCIPHEIDSFNADEAGHLRAVTEAGRLQYLTLGDVGAQSMRRLMRSWADSLSMPAWEVVPVESFAPVFTLPSLAPKPRRKGVTKAAILGRIRQESRGYARIISDLEQAINADPKLWGYKMTQTDPQGYNSEKRPHLEPKGDPFQLHIIGRAEDGTQVQIPELMGHYDHPIVQIHSDMNGTDVYELIHDMDVVIPAFADKAYTQDRASGSVPTAIVAETPLLATPDIIDAYTYLSPIAYRPAPNGWSEITALAALRRGEDPWTAAFGSALAKLLPPVGPNAFWCKQPPISWPKYHAALARKNDEVWRRILERQAVALP